MMRLTAVGLFRMIVITAIVVKVKGQKSPMGLAQNMDDGSRVRVSESYSRPKDAKHIDRDEGGGPPAQKSLFHASQHVV
jgi:hypothetical protein